MSPDSKPNEKSPTDEALVDSFTQPVADVNTLPKGKEKASEQSHVESMNYDEPSAAYTELDIPEADKNKREAKLNFVNGDYAAASECYSKALQIYASVYGELSSELGELYLWYGDAMLQQLREDLQLMEGDDNEEYEDTWNVLECARVIFERDSPKSKLLAMTYRKLGELNDHVCEEFEKAIVDYKIAIHILEKISPPDERGIAELLYLTGLSQCNLKNYVKAADAYGGAIAALKSRMKAHPGEAAELEKLLPDLEIKVEDALAMEKDFIKQKSNEDAEKEVLKSIFKTAMDTAAVQTGLTTTSKSAGSSGASSNTTGAESLSGTKAVIADLTGLVRRAKPTLAQNTDVVTDGSASVQATDLSGLIRSTKQVDVPNDLTSLVKRKQPVLSTESTTTTHAFTSTSTSPSTSASSTVPTSVPTPAPHVSVAEIKIAKKEEDQTVTNAEQHNKKPRIAMDNDQAIRRSLGKGSITVNNDLRNGSV
eukprot:CFRG8275T1